ncbi:MAG: FixH family protein [Novosphingobium sp.]
MNSTFTGKHMAAIMIAFFGLVIVVNLAMARLARSTFGGVVVENSYVASQHFNKWLDEARSEKALGWTAQASRTAQGGVILRLSGLPAGDARVSATARHPLGRMADIDLAFVRRADGAYISSRPLPAGRWKVRLSVTSGGRTWRQEQDLM